ncbi:MAG TPA: hypothetical protein PKY87_08825 [Terricaulis sp.]|nr:hypothetical protein [Terricaulis sp.]
MSLVVEDDAGNSAEITLFCDAPDKRAHMDALLAAAAKGLADLAIAEAQKKAEDTTGDAEAVTEAAVASETPTGITNADDEEEPF